MKKMVLAVSVGSALLLIFFLQSCHENARAKDQIANAETPAFATEEFKKYWYAGKAEISSFKLSQVRYGELHQGTATLIFVTEDFSKSKQVKLDQPQGAGNDRLPVFKMNFTRKFNTGIYPYSVMLSVFSPVDILLHPHAVKSAASVQEWCGMTFMQFNHRNSRYEAEWHSYFENESDGKATFETTWLEDELWNRIRLDPENLPTGMQKVLPGSVYTRFAHQPLQVRDAKLRLEKRTGKNLYFIEYPELDYLLLITFKNEFPYQVIGWEETFPGFDGNTLTTTGILDKTILTDYWNHHSNEDRTMREHLNLQKNF